jgi:polysaccharide export outer membrane protein
VQENPMVKQCEAAILFVLLAAIMPGGTRAKANPGQSTEARTVANSKAQPKPTSSDSSYLIGPRDVLDISVWKEPDLTRLVPVRPDGKISLPLLNDVQASGLTPMQLAAQITNSLQKYVTNPEVTVIVTETNSQRIYILGEVSHTGAYTLIPGMTVLQALSNAGGPTPFAHVSKIYVLRQENGKQSKLFFNYKEAIKGKETQQNIALMPGDTVVVP